MCLPVEKATEALKKVEGTWRRDDNAVIAKWKETGDLAKKRGAPRPADDLEEPVRRRLIAGSPARHVPPKTGLPSSLISQLTSPKA
jgi:hypothetical protein